MKDYNECYTSIINTIESKVVYYVLGELVNSDRIVFHIQGSDYGFQTDYRFNTTYMDMTFVVEASYNAINDETRKLLYDKLELERYFSSPLYADIPKEFLTWFFFLLRELGRVKIIKEAFKNSDSFENVKNELYFVRASELYKSNFAFKHFSILNKLPKEFIDSFMSVYSYSKTV